LDTGEVRSTVQFQYSTTPELLRSSIPNPAKI